jgi:type II restriction enzyme
MKRAISQGQTPNLFLLQYTRPDLLVKNVMLIPHFAFTASILEKRKPLSPDAERAGWVGCNFMLDRVPLDAQIHMIQDGNVASAARVREKYKRLRPLEKFKVEKRGWTLDVLNVVRSIRKQSFELSDVYALENSLAMLHPENRHIRDKIRQQLQVLRDLGLLEFLGNGSYKLRTF